MTGPTGPWFPPPAPSSVVLMTDEINAFPPQALALSSMLFSPASFGFVVPVPPPVGPPLAPPIDIGFAPSVWVYLTLLLGGAMTTSPGADNPSISGWFLNSPDRVTFEYGTASGNLVESVAQITAATTIDGIYYDGVTPPGSAYVFDLTNPASIAVGTYVGSPPSGTTVPLSANAAGDASGDSFAFVNAPSRQPDFAFNFAQRTYMASELVATAAAKIIVPSGQYCKVLLQNNLGTPGTLPATGNILTMVLSPEMIGVTPGSLLATPGAVRYLAPS